MFPKVRKLRGLDLTALAERMEKRKLALRKKCECRRSGDPVAAGY